VIGEDKNGMQRDYWYSSARNGNDLDAPEMVGRTAGERTVRRLNGRKLDTRTCPVVFEAQIATGLIGTTSPRCRAACLYRKSSFLLDSLGKPSCAAHQHPRKCRWCLAVWAAHHSTAKASPASSVTS